MGRVSFDELLEMTATGCPKPAMRSVEYARRWNVKLHVRSAFTWEPGTWVLEEDQSMEQAIVSAVTARHERGQGHGHRACPTTPASRPACSASWPTST